MRKVLILAVMVVLVGVTSMGSGLALGTIVPVYAERPIEIDIIICHIPPGNPAGAVTIVVASPAVAAHVAHGDSIGECQPG